MDRIPRTATVVISAVTALAWLLALLAGPAFNAPYFLGFIPARFSGLVMIAPAVPTFLTPLTATLVHSGLIHLGFNLLVFLWCGAQVERVLGRVGLILLYVVGAYASAMLQWAASPGSIVPMIGASGAISAVIGAFALSFGRAKAFTNNLRVNRWINVAWLMIAWVDSAGDDGLACRRSGISARDAGAHRRLCSGAAAPAPAAALPLPQGLSRLHRSRRALRDEAVNLVFEDR